MGAVLFLSVPAFDREAVRYPDPVWSRSPCNRFLCTVYVRRSPAHVTEPDMKRHVVKHITFIPYVRGQHIYTQMQTARVEETEPGFFSGTEDGTGRHVLVMWDGVNWLEFEKITGPEVTALNSEVRRQSYVAERDAHDALRARIKTLVEEAQGRNSASAHWTEIEELLEEPE